MTIDDKLAAAGLLKPDYGGKELGAVLPAALAAVGASAVVPGRNAEADRLRLGIPEARHVVVVMLDGLGHHLLDSRKGHAPFLRSIFTEVVTAGFPTTTATSLALFGTGQAAGVTGMAGYTARNPLSGTLANLVSWDGAPAPTQWQQAPSLLERAHESGLTVTSLGKHAFAGSGLTQAALRGGKFVGTETLGQRVTAALIQAKEPGVTYCYAGEIDAAGHRFGWQSGEWVAALEDADRELRRLAAGLPRSSIMVVTADHGMVDVAGERRWDIADFPHLQKDVALVGGEPRAVHLYLSDPSKAQAVVETWQSTLGEHGVVMTREEAVSAGLLGRLDQTVAQRFGDVIVAMAGRATIVDSRMQTPASLALVGMHGSLTPEELHVPVLLAQGAAR